MEDKQTVKYQTETNEMVLPVTVQVFPPMEKYEKNIKTEVPEPKYSKEKPIFWRLFFKEKLCKNFSKNKSECICKKKKNYKTNEFEYEEKHINNDTTMSKNSELMQSKCNYPLISKRGIGCHLYFCIDKKRKKGQIKPKPVATHNSENPQILPMNLPKCECDPKGASKESDPNYSDICLGNQEFANYSTPELPSSKTHSGEHKYSNISLYSKNFNCNSNSRVTSESTILENTFGSKVLENKCESTRDKIKNKFSSRNFLDVLNSPRVCTSEEIQKHKKQEIQDNIQTYLGGNHAKYDILQDKTNSFFHIDNTNTNPFMEKVNMFSTGEKIDNKKPYNSHPLLNNNSDVSKQIEGEKDKVVLKERLEQCSTSSSSKGFARNSMTSLRSEQRQSQLEGSVSLILDKLANIEDKITDLEKRSCEKENNITMGICAPRKSKSSIKVKKNTNKTIENSGVILPSEKVSNVVKIKSHGNNIVITGPKDVNILSNKPANSMKPRDVVHYNAYEMDVHTIASKCQSKPIKCEYPERIIEHIFSNSTDCGVKWRRVSEELKISQPAPPKSFLMSM